MRRGQGVMLPGRAVDHVGVADQHRSGGADDGLDAARVHDVGQVLVRDDEQRVAGRFLVVRSLGDQPVVVRARGRA